MRASELCLLFFSLRFLLERWVAHVQGGNVDVIHR